MKEEWIVESVILPNKAQILDNTTTIVMEAMYARPSQIAQIFSISTSELSRHISYIRQNQSRQRPIVLTLGPRLTLINIKGFEKYLILKSDMWLKEA